VACGSSRAAFLGQRPAGLIARPWAIAILLELAHAPRRPHELERRIPGLTHAALMRRLAQLTRAGVIAHRHSPVEPPRAHHVLTDSGRELLALAELAARWEARTRVRTRALPGMWALRTLADERALEVLCALSEEELDARELALSVRPIAEGALLRRLTAHTREGLLARRQAGGTTLHRPSEDARRLGALALRAMAWEVRWSRPAPARAGADLVAMLRLSAPLAAPPTDLAGVCGIRVVPASEPGCGVWLRAESGRLLTLARAPTAPAQAVGHASVSDWLHALLENRRRAVTTVGDAGLLTGVLDAISTLADAPRRAADPAQGGARL